VADGENLWEKHGLAPTVSKQASGRAATDAVLGKKAAFGTTTDSVIVLAGMRGLKPIVLADFARSVELFVTARTDRGIDTPEQLKGKQIATQIGTSGHYYLSKFLSVYGLTTKDVRIVNVSSSDMVTALLRGDVDAFAWSFRNGQIAEHEGKGKVRMLSNAGVDKVWINHLLLVANEDVVTKSPDVCRAAVASLLDAEGVLLEHTDRAASIVAARTETSVEDTLEGFKLNNYKVQLDPRLMVDLLSNAQWAIEMGLAVRPSADLATTFRGLIDDRFLRELKPERVTI
jgi:ABC-type nitrate/sulfonate/bicarbonate transport system substrate-binding protein